MSEEYTDNILYVSVCGFGYSPCQPQRWDIYLLAVFKVAIICSYFNLCLMVVKFFRLGKEKWAKILTLVLVLNNETNGSCDKATY